MKRTLCQSNSVIMRATLVTIAAFLAVALASCTSQAGNQPIAPDRNTQANTQTAKPDQEGKMKLGAPAAIAAEHREIHEQLEAAIKAGGKTGAAAKMVEEKLSEHFKKEEEYALPQLGLLRDLAEGRTSSEEKRAIELSDKLKADMPKMLEEHKGIVEALEALRTAATEEKNQQAMMFVEKLGSHAQTEEQVMYPAAILVGEYLKLKGRP